MAFDIKNGLLNISLKGGDQSKTSVAKLAKRICFKDNEHLLLINKGGMRCVINFFKDEIVQTTQIDNFLVNDFSHKHSLRDMKPLAP